MTGGQDGLRMYVASEYDGLDTQLTASQRQEQLTAPRSRELEFQVLELSDLT